MKLDDAPRRFAMCRVVSVHAILLVEAGVLSNVLDIDGGLGCESRPGVRAGGPFGCLVLLRSKTSRVV